jgi:hypothetical protein
MTVSEGVMIMIPKHLGGVVPKYSAQWWERVSIVPAEESAKEENLPLSTAWSMPSYTYGRDVGIAGTSTARCTENSICGEPLNRLPVAGQRAPGSPRSG